MNTEHLRTIAQWYIEEGRYRILWHHIRKKHLLIEENTIVSILMYGSHDYDKEQLNRFIARGKVKRKKYRVVYEYDIIESEDCLIVITAFEEER